MESQNAVESKPTFPVASPVVPMPSLPAPDPALDHEFTSSSGHGLHVAIISDGNGRWATSRGLPRSAGHRAGAEAARRIIEAAPRLGIHTLTLFALSSANWKRPAAEVNAILRLLHEYLLTETAHCVEEGVRLSVIGRRDRISATLRQAIADSEAATARGTRLHLRLAIDYSAREAIFHAACRFYKVTELSPESFSRVLEEVYRGGSTEVDLLIRTGGEQRLSDFLLWECAFAEFVFVRKAWPDFTAADLEAALGEFAQRERTRGALPDALAG
ncbi:MAG TPA: polyprenyl diphosphate synthase [Candidatus Acidoferrum sp.]|nr:polyprenyl diphosphate synthase [Candidatus Acidoferrum sp.]